MKTYAQFTAAETLVNTSIDDARSSLRCARGNGGMDMDTLTTARDLAATLGQSTRVKLLEAENRWVGRQK